MRIIVRPSERSTPDAPLYFWRLYDGNLCRGFGTAESEQAARAAAEGAEYRLDPYAVIEENPLEADETLTWLLGQGALK